MGWEWWLALGAMGVVSCCLGIVIGFLLAGWGSIKPP
jgi:hypothetical protein